MDGLTFHCAYLGFSAISKPPTSMSVLQSPVKDLYFEYRKTPATGRTASLKLLQHGVLVSLFENGAVSAELFFELTSVTFVEAAKFMPVKSSERKPKAIFVSADESKSSLSDKNSFQLDKAYHFLIAASHPPLVVCVVRRPAGVKALDCHVFALDTTENALHISALIASKQASLVKGDTAGDIVRGRGSFDRGVRGDVIRTDVGEYSVYRGPPHLYNTGPPQPHSTGPMSEVHLDQRGYGGGLVQSRSGNVSYPDSRPITLTQDNFRGHPTQQPFSGGPGSKGYEQANYGIPVAIGYSRPPDVIMHAQQRSEVYGQYSPHDRHVAGFGVGPGGGRQMYELRAGNMNNAILSGGAGPEARISGGPDPINHLPLNMVLTGNKMPTRPTEMAPTFLGDRQQHSDPVSSPLSPMGNVPSTRSHQVFSPTSPQGVDTRDALGPVFSASNLESRGQGAEPQINDRPAGGKPIAKVPPHMRGIKVLPSDFRMVKLKPKSEKRSDATSDEEYDNNKELAEKYKEYQLQENSRYNNPEFIQDNADNWSQPSHNTNMNGVPHGRTKELQIETMFSKFRLQDGANSQDMYRQVPGRSQIDDGLGYLP